MKCDIHHYFGLATYKENHSLLCHQGQCTVLLMGLKVVALHACITYRLAIKEGVCKETD